MGKMPEPKLVVIIPAYNEEATIRNVIEDYHRVFPSARIIIVDNASTDGTNDIARNTLSSQGIQGTILFESRKGKGNAIRNAFYNIDADIYLMVDADMTYPAKDAVSMVAAIEENRADMVVGNRHAEGKYREENSRIFHGFGNKLVKFLINTIYKSNLEDILSGMRVFNRLFVKCFPIESTGFEIETELTLHALENNYRILELPVDYKDRPEGSLSKLNTIFDGTRVLRKLFSIYRNYKPFTFFTFVAVIFLLFGILSGAPVIYEYFTTRYITHVPLSILAAGFIILSVINFSIAIILDVIRKNFRLQYQLFVKNFLATDKNSGK